MCRSSLIAFTTSILCAASYAIPWSEPIYSLRLRVSVAGKSLNKVLALPGIAHNDLPIGTTSTQTSSLS
jgi:hypothetical protein